MTTLTPERVVLGIHVAAGVLALLTGGVALVTTKGGERHRRAGRGYVRSMAVVVATVVPLLAFDPGDFARQFLLLVAVFSGYLVFSGYRVLARKRPAAGGEPVDWAAAGLALVASSGLAGWGVLLAVSGTPIGLAMAVFGAIGAGAAVAELRDFRNPGRRDPWLADHLGRMLGGYIATVTAVSAVNLAGVVPTAVAWLWPTAVGVPLILYWQGQYAGVGPFASAGE